MTKHIIGLRSLNNTLFMHKKLYIFITFTILNIGLGYAQDVQLRIDTICNDSIYLKVLNITSDTMYLFDSYFEYADNVHLHRYAILPKRYYLSFVPLLPFIGWGPHHRGTDRIVNRGFLDYHFIFLLPHSSQMFSLPITSLLSRTFYRDFDAKAKFYYGIKFRNKRTTTARKITIVVAVYKDVQNMNSVWIRQNGLNENPVLNKLAYDYVSDYLTYSYTIDLSQLNQIRHNQHIHD